MCVALVWTAMAIAAHAVTSGEAIVPSVRAESQPGDGDSSTRARLRDFDARIRVPCAQERGESMGECDAAVARGDGGDATVVVTFANGFTRTLFFERGAFARGSATMSGTGTDTDWRFDGREHRIRVDDQRYVLPDAFVFGH